MRYLTLIGALIGAAAFAPPPVSGPVQPQLLAGLKWRNIGPFRGGRITAVTGAMGQPGVYYIGTPVGGVWKTTSAGTTWFPVFDDIKDVSSIGAVEVAPSNPNIVYVGTGSTNEGNGMYKSTDAGRTWQHLGLDSTRQIPSMLVDPTNPDIVLIAAEGSVRSADGFHGAFRTTDGGRTWNRTLFVDNTTGVTDFARAWDKPEVILAATIRRRGGFGGGGGGGGGANQGPTGTHVFKSTDGGVTWTELTGGGLPPLTGRLSVAIAQRTNAQRMFIIGPVGIGLWRSDDAGATWRRMDASDVRVANGQGNYSSGVYVNTGNPDTVYTIATTVYRSTNGGESFDGWKGSPGGDDPQVMWLDPTDPKRMLLGTDQGAQVTFDAGETWSSWYNQPMEQIYHISVDNSFPYWIYGTQQDACAIQIKSRGDLGEVGPLDWSPNPGFERGSIVPDPLNPNIIYALNMTAGIMRITNPSGQWINIAPNQDTSLGLRQNGDQPLAFNASNGHELLAGYQYLMATTDGGMHWRKLSPDLTVAGGATPAPAPAPAQGGGPAGLPGTITTISSSAVVPGVIWVGTSNGLIQVTRNHGLAWTNVSVQGMQGGAISAIDASHLDGGTAYVALRERGEFGPSFYRTHDYGHTWTKIVSGLPADQAGGSFARVIRADTRKAGLLFAGTESSFYVSFDDGDNWQSLMTNLPTTSYRDAVVKDNDLVVATYGRGIWILDDISPLRELTPDLASEAAHLFKPGDAVRVRRDVNGDTPMQPEMPHAENPPPGAVIYYSLGSQPSGDISLDILDASGTVIRHMSSAPIPPLPDAPPFVAPYWLEVPQPMPTTVGLNRVNWNIRYDNPPAFNHNINQVMSAVPHETPYSPEGPLALPGTYTARLTVNGQTYQQSFSVRNDPRSPATLRDLEAQHALQMKLYAGARESWDGWHQVAAIRDGIAQVLRNNPPADVSSAAMPFDSMLAKLQGDPKLQTAGRFGRQTAPSGNFATLTGSEPGESDVLSSMNGQLRTTDYGDMAPSEAMLKNYSNACTDLREAVSSLRRIDAEALPAFNQVLARNNIPAIPVPSGTLALPSCGSQAPVASRGGHGRSSAADH